MQDDDLYASDIATIAATLPVLRNVVARQANVIEINVFRQIDDGTLTADKALAFWHARHAQHKMLSSLEGKVRSLPITHPNLVDPNRAAGRTNTI